MANVVLTAIFAALVAMEKPWFPTSAAVLTGIAVLINLIALFIERRKTPVKPTEPPSPLKGQAPRVAEGSLDRAHAPAVLETKAPLPANHPTDEAPHGEIPPWLRLKGNIVMNWHGKYHVAPINGDDPFEVAQRLYARLNNVEPAAEEPVRSAEQTG